MPCRARPAEVVLRPAAPARRVGLRAALAVLLGVAVFLEVNGLAGLYPWSSDWSRGSVFTLSERSLRVVETLERQVAITALVSEALEARGVGRAELLRRVLERYGEATDRVTVRLIDPEREPAAFAEARKRRPFLLGRSTTGSGAPEQGVLVESGERASFRSLDELFPPPADARSSSVPVAVESGVTAAILEVAAAERPAVCLTTGHGEWDLAGPEGEALLRAHLASDAFAVRTLEPDLPVEELGTCTVLVVAGPSLGFLAPEAERLRRRLEQGGRLLVLLDAAAEGTARSAAAAGLGSLLARVGIEASAAPMRETDPGRMYDPGSATLVVGTVGPSFEPTAVLAGRPVVVLQAAGLRPTGPESRAVPIATAADSTDVEGWGGGLALAMAAELGACGGADRPACGRLVVFGGSTVLFPPFAASGETANLAVVRSAVAWLADRPGALPLPPVLAERVRLFLEPGTLRLLWWWLIVAMPIGAAVAGLFVLRSRRRGEG